MQADIFRRRKKSFVLWLPARTSRNPSLVIGSFRFGAPPFVADEKSLPLTETMNGLWEIEASDCALTDGQVYHYWFEVTDDCPWRTGARIRCTDPFATAVDWRVCAAVPDGYDDNDSQPAAVILYSNGELVTCDMGGERLVPEADLHHELKELSSNCATVIYEIPCRWAQTDESRVMGIGTFQDVRSLVDRETVSPNFAGVRLLNKGYAVIQDLGVNAIELLPIFDSWQHRQWGYGPTNFFAPDSDLSCPESFSWPQPNSSLQQLVDACHRHKIRVLMDVVCSFGQHDPYIHINDTDMHTPMVAVQPGEKEADVYNRAEPEQRSSRTGEIRKDWGGRLFRYIREKEDIYDPISGTERKIVPARQYKKASVERWIRDFHIDGIRLDSLETVANWDFIREYKNHARVQFKELWKDFPNEADSRFIVAGEELWIPLDLIKEETPGDPASKRVDALWNEKFKDRVRSAIIGKNYGDDNFEWTVRRMVDCTKSGFADGAEAINYVTSHDIESGKRLYDYLDDKGIAKKEERCKLAFVCLLTSVGIPMMLAGEEFGDKCDLSTEHPYKQLDTINYDRLQYAFDQRDGKAAVGGIDFRWRARLFDEVKTLISLRKKHPALCDNRTDFLHADFDDGKRVVAWRRGAPDAAEMVVVVANFSDYGTPDPFHNEYRVNNWPATPAGKKWREITQKRDVAPEWVGRESIFPWEAKVYALVEPGKETMWE